MNKPDLVCRSVQKCEEVNVSMRNGHWCINVTTFHSFRPLDLESILLASRNSSAIKPLLLPAIITLLLASPSRVFHLPTALLLISGINFHINYMYRAFVSVSAFWGGRAMT